MLRSLAYELRRATRALLARPAFSLLVVLTLALGIGGNTAVFSAIEGLLLRPLPYPHSERLVSFGNADRNSGAADGASTVADYLDRHEQADALDDSGMYYDYSYDLAEQGAPQRISGVVATPSLFSTLGVHAQLGRTFSADDAEPDGDRGVMWVSGQHVVLLGDALWKGAFAADTAIVGRDIRLSGQSYRVIGVMPPSFAFPRREVQLWLPFAFSDKQKSDAMRGFEFGHSIGRLKAGASIAQLDAQFDAIAARNLQRHPAAAASADNDFWNLARSNGFTGRAHDLHERLVGDIDATLWLLQAAVALVLAIACANVANLMLMRLAGRQRELAVRAALGGTRRRIALQLIVESMTLALCGGAIGIAIAYACIALMRKLQLDGAAAGFRVALDLPVLGFAFALMVLTGLVCGLAPILSLWRGPGWESLKEGARGSVGGRSARAMRSALVVIQLGLAVALLVGAGLLTHSFWRLQGQDPGFDSDKLISINLNLSRDRYRQTAQTRLFQDNVLAAVRAVPGVKSAGLISDLPFSSDDSSNPYFIDGRERDAEVRSAYMQSVDEGLFPTLGIAVLRGRNFLASDDERAPPVAIIDEQLARREFGARDPLGQRIATRSVNGLDWRTIVGVVASIKRHRLSEAAGGGTYYWPSRQSTTRIFRIAIRSDIALAALAAPLRDAVTQIDPEQPVWDMMSMRERIDRSLDGQRTPMLLVLLFAALAIALSGVGIYGVLSFAVAQRTGEIGVRMSLGASPQQILRTVLVDGARLVAIGIVLGGALALALGQQLRSQLFGVDVVDPLTLTAVLALVAAIALVASAIPARRAAHTSPLEALRNE